MIAEAPISDARAKSEARRAKILAREAARLSASKEIKVKGKIGKPKEKSILSTKFGTVGAFSPHSLTV